MDIRIVIAARHTILREGLRRTLDREPGFTVVGEVETKQELINLVRALTVDVIILDSEISMNKGFLTIKEIIHSTPTVKIILLSLYTEKYYVKESIKSGITGYVLKNNAISEVVLAVKRVMEGKSYISSEIQFN